MKIGKNLLLVLVIALSSSVFVACGGGTVESNVDDEASTEEVAETEAAAEDAEGEEVAEEEVEEGDYEPAKFTLVNDTDRPLLEFYVSAPSEEEWGENLIPEGKVVAENSEATVTIDDGRPDCAYDILGYFGASPDGSVGEGELIQSGVEICDGTTYTYFQE